MQAQNGNQKLNGVPEQRPRAMTVEELEREMRSQPAPSSLPTNHMSIQRQPITSSNTSLPLPIGTPPRSHLVQHMPQQVGHFTLII